VFVSNELLVSAAKDGSLRTWRVGNPEPRHVYMDQTVEVLSVSRSYDAVLASGSANGAVRLWGFMANDKLVPVRNVHQYEQPIRMVVFCVHQLYGLMLCCAVDAGDGGGYLEFLGLDQLNGTKSTRVRCATSIACLAASQDGRVITYGSSEATVHQIDPTSGEVIRTIDP
jgi:WD40 repeat protein